MTINEWLRLAAKKMSAAGIDGPAHDARTFLQEIAEISPTDRLLRGDDALPGTTLDALTLALERRCRREPLNYILGHAYFRTLKLKTPPYVLTPRPDSETLIDAALKHAPDRHKRRILDLGTGTGCLALSLLAEWPDAAAIAVDIDPRLAQLARDNAAKNGLSSRFSAICADWDTCLTGQFDVIISNPPYIPADIVPTLSTEVSSFEPSLALDGGMDGLDYDRKLIDSTAKLLATDGVMIVELGFDQAASFAKLVDASILNIREVCHDYAGHARAIVLERISDTMTISEQ